MQRQPLPELLAQRTTSAQAAANKAIERTELQQKIDDFFARGGQVAIIPNGVSGGQDGILPPNEDPGTSMAICRPNKNQVAKKTPEKVTATKHDPTEGGLYVNQAKAAAMIGLHPSYLAILIGRNQIDLKVKKIASRCKYFLRSDVEALPAYEKRNSNRSKNK